MSNAALPASTSLRSRNFFRAMMALAAYAGLTAIFLWPLVAHLNTHILSNDQFTFPGNGGDEFPFLWMYWWMDKAISTFSLPFNCDWIFPPTGGDLTYRSIPILPIVLTCPIGHAFGPITGNNVMVLAMITFGAWAYYLVVRSLLDVSAAAAFIAGALFGFCPYFIWKAGGHYNLIGAAFWAPALGAICASYMSNAFTWRRSIVFAIFLWATYWSSYVEFFMLAIVTAIVIGVFEIALFLNPRGLTSGQYDVTNSPAKAMLQRANFFAPALVGAISLYPALHTPSQGIVAPVQFAVTLWDLIPSAKLSIFSELGFPNRTEAVVPHSFVYLSAIGLWFAHTRRLAMKWPIAVIALILLCLTINAGGIPEIVLRNLPLGGGFRIFSRFIPLLFFFLLLFAAVGIDKLIRLSATPRNSESSRRTRSIARSVLAGLLIFAALELYPALLHVTEIPRLPMTAELHERIDDGRFCLVIPAEKYYTAYDSLQIQLDIPCVHHTYWWHMDIAQLRAREAQFPAIYPSSAESFPDAPVPVPDHPDFRCELDELKIGYLLFLDKSQAAPFRNDTGVVFETPDMIMLALRTASE